MIVSGAQVGFARVVSDFATVAYLGDVFVLESHRGRGLSKWMMECIMQHPALQNLRRWILLTRDAHGLYSQVWIHAGEVARTLHGIAPARRDVRDQENNMKNSTLTKMYRPLYENDPQIAAAIDNETRRQHEGLELIASENFVSEAVLEAAGSVFTNKYAEGYPGKRYYGGCEFADVVENLARDRAKQLFGAEHANVQPHAGSQANMEAYAAVLQPGDTILGLNLAHGGHLTHGHHLNFSGKTYKIVPYGVTKETETIDYDELEKLAEQERPKLIIGGGSAYPRIIDFARMRQIADKVGALYLVDMAHFAGLVAGGAHPSPVPHAHIVTSTTHKTLRGPRSGMILSKAEFAQAIDKVVFPGMQGGPLVHIMAAKAVCFQEAMQPEFRDYARQVVANAKVLAQIAGRRRLPHHFRRHRHAPDAGRRVLQGHAGQRGGKGAGRSRNHGQQECDSVRHQSADEAERHPHRHAGADHARHERSRDAPDRPLDRRSRCSIGPTRPC